MLGVAERRRWWSRRMQGNGFGRAIDIGDGSVYVVPRLLAALANTS